MRHLALAQSIIFFFLWESAFRVTLTPHCRIVNSCSWCSVQWRAALEAVGRSRCQLIEAKQHQTFNGVDRNFKSDLWESSHNKKNRVDCIPLPPERKKPDIRFDFPLKKNSDFQTYLALAPQLTIMLGTVRCTMTYSRNYSESEFRLMLDCGMWLDSWRCCHIWSTICKHN